MRRKWLTIGITLLFIGIAIAPSINCTIVEPSNGDDFVEVTTQACGIGGYGAARVKLTREQYLNLQQYLVDFRERLNKTTTREEAVPIFKDAVVKLDTYGLLPKVLNIDRAQKLVVGLYKNTKLITYLESQPALQEANKNCFIVGMARGNTYFQGPINKAVYLFLYTLVAYSLKYNVGDILTAFLMILLLINVYKTITLSEIVKNLPYIGGTIYYGYKNGGPGTLPLSNPAEGTIWTSGANGVKNWTGKFYGTLPAIPLTEFLNTYYPGANGFTGLRLNFLQTNFYFGFALNVNVSYLS